jgi:hypothetical protein
MSAKGIKEMMEIKGYYFLHATNGVAIASKQDSNIPAISPISFSLPCPSAFFSPPYTF